MYRISYGLVFTQVLASAVTDWLLVLSLVGFFEVQPVIATAAGIAFAFDPLQLLQERLVLPETFTLLTFALFTVVGLQYLVLPMLAWVSNRTRTGDARLTTHLVGHLVLAAALTLCLHASYRWLIFEQSGYSGTYQQDDGFYLALAWAPMIEPQDTSYPRVAAVLEQLPVSGHNSRRDFSNRDLERWLDGGLVDRLIRAFDGDSRAANLAAGNLAYRTLWRDPIGIVEIATKTYLGFCGIEWDVKGQLLEDQGEHQWFSLAIRALVRERFGLDPGPDYQHRRTAIKRYHLVAHRWYACLALAPLVLLAALALGQPGCRPLTTFVFSETENSTLLDVP